MSFFYSVCRYKFCILLERHIRRATCFFSILGLLLKLMFRSQAIAYVSVTFAENCMLFNKLFVDLFILNDVVRNKIQNCQITLRVKHHWHIRKIKTAVFIG